MLSPADEKMTRGERISLRSRYVPGAALISPRASRLPTNSSLTIEQISCLVEQVEAAPPPLEVEEPRRLGIDVGVQVVVLVPEGVGRVEALEVGDQVGAVELAVAQVADQPGEPGPAQQAAEVAHRALARSALQVAAPVRHRGAVDDERAGQLRACGGQKHHRPPALAVAEDDGLRAVRVPRRDRLNESRLRRHDVADRLSRHRVGEEDHEVDWVTGLEGDADLRFLLEPTDARAVARRGSTIR